MKYSKWAVIAACAAFMSVVITISPHTPKANIKPHPLCKAIVTYASVDGCLVYDTGRTSGTPFLSSPKDAQELLQAIHFPDDVDVLILGESHDNPHHHKLRAKLVAVSARAIVMEQLRADQEAGLAAFNSLNRNAATLGTIEDFKKTVDWSNGGWDKYPYDPLLGAVVETRAPIYAGDPPRDTIRKIAKEGIGALPEAERARLALDKPLGEKLDAVSAREIEDSHCGMLPESAVPRMAIAQRYRDAHIADATLKATAEHGRAVLLTGNIHALTDRGVPWYIRARAPNKKVVSVVLVEVEESKTDPEAYVPRDPDGKPAADYVIFTPTIKREDPCAAFAK